MRTSSVFYTRMWPLPLLLLSLSRGDHAAYTTAALPPAHSARAAAPGEIAKKKLTEAYGMLPIGFELNQGQTDGQVRFLSRGAGYSLFLTSTEAVFALRTPGTHWTSKEFLSERAGARAEVVESLPAVMRMKLVAAKLPVEVRGDDPLPGRSHYFIGNHPKNWRADVSTYARVQYKDVYPGVDLVYHGTQHQLEYDFVVAPGANPNVIGLSFQGVESIEVDAGGDLVLRVAGREVRQPKPDVYQDVDGVRHPVSGSYFIEANSHVRFKVGAYDSGRPLVIDPILVYSTYLGGSGVDFLFGVGSIAVDASGSAYITGATSSIDFPTTAGVFQTTYGGGTTQCSSDAFVSKLDPTGSALVYSSYLGGRGCDASNGIAVDTAGNAYVAGWTDSDDFPTTPGALQPTCPGCMGKAFVTKLDAAGSALVYSTYLGGTAGAAGSGIALDGSRNAYVTGSTSAGFPVTPGAFQPIHGGGSGDRFVAKLNATGSALVYSSYLGGSSGEEFSHIAVDRFDNAYVTGLTFSSDFPTTAGAFQRTCPPHSGGPGPCVVAFVTKVDPAGSSLLYSTYLGGNTSAQAPGVSSQGSDIAVDASGQAYVGGIAYSSDFPTTPGAFQTTYGGDGDDAFVTKLNSSGTALVYSTYLGGQAEDGAYGIAIDTAGNAYVTGFTGSTDFPTASAFQPALAGADDVFIAKLNAEGSGLIYSSYLGGSSIDQGFGIAADSAGSAYVTGDTGSPDFPVVNAVQPVYGDGFQDAIVAKIGEEPSCPEDVTDQVDVFRSRFYRILFTPFRFQWVVIRNKTTAPIQGPLAYVMEDLQNATFLGSPLKTACFSPSGDPFIVIHAGSDEVLSPDEWVLAFLLSFKTNPGRITYTPRVLSGIPTR